MLEPRPRSHNLKAPYGQVRLWDAIVHLAESVTSQTPVRIQEDRCAAACSMHFLNGIMGCVTHWSWLVSLVFLLVSRSTLASYSTIRVLSAAYKTATLYIPTSVLSVFLPPKYLHQYLLFIFSCSQACGCLQGSSCVCNRCVWWRVYSHMTTVVHGGRKGGGSPKAGVAACCELPSVSDRSCTPVLCENCSWLLSRLFSIFCRF